MQITEPEILAIIGAKEVELHLLRTEVAKLKAAIETLTKPAADKKD